MHFPEDFCDGIGVEGGVGLDEASDGEGGHVDACGGEFFGKAQGEGAQACLADGEDRGGI